MRRWPRVRGLVGGFLGRFMGEFVCRSGRVRSRSGRVRVRSGRVRSRSGRVRAFIPCRSGRVRHVDPVGHGQTLAGSFRAAASPASRADDVAPFLQPSECAVYRCLAHGALGSDAGHGGVARITPRDIHQQETARCRQVGVTQRQCPFHAGEQCGTVTRRRWGRIAHASGTQQAMKLRAPVWDRSPTGAFRFRLGRATRAGALPSSGPATGDPIAAWAACCRAAQGRNRPEA